MDKLDWLETFELGIPSVDADHRHLLNIMKQIETAANAAKFETCKDLLDELVVASKNHFAREEALLEETGYPNAAIHKDYHARLLSRAQSVKDVCKEIGTRENLKDCCHEMFEFLIDDIVKGDVNFKSFLEEKGLIKRS